MGAVSGAPGSSSGQVTVRIGMRAQTQGASFAHGPQTSGDPVPALAAIVAFDVRWASGPRGVAGESAAS
ncbi:MAG: hypothetical protein QOJ47_374, partial [Gaiellales bacterium]|nr:hypothetical protein [Gaiellales bacterium]